MKNSGIVAALGMLLTLGGTAASCKKIQSEPASKAQIITEHLKIGGDDDEDPVIRGKVKKSNFSAVENASVETVTYGSNAIVDTAYTDSQGEFVQKTAAGIYYFRVTVPGGSPENTDTIHLSTDRDIQIIVN